MRKNILALWFVPFDSDLKPLAFQEKKWQKKLSNSRAIQYAHSRGYVREALSHIVKMSY